MSGAGARRVELMLDGFSSLDVGDLPDAVPESID